VRTISRATGRLIAEDTRSVPGDAFGRRDLISCSWALPRRNLPPLVGRGTTRRLLLRNLHLRLPQPHSIEPSIGARAQRNIELMWLTGRLAPDFKTIADFPRQHGASLRAVCRRFVQLCRDEAFQRGDRPPSTAASSRRSTSRDRNFTPTRSRAVSSRSRRASSVISMRWRRADRSSRPSVEAKTERLREKIKTCRAE